MTRRLVDNLKASGLYSLGDSPAVSPVRAVAPPGEGEIVRPGRQVL